MQMLLQIVADFRFVESLQNFATDARASLDKVHQRRGDGKLSCD